MGDATSDSFVIIGLLLGQYVVPASNQLAHQIKHDKPLLSSAINGYWDKQANRIINIDYAQYQRRAQKTLKFGSPDDTAHIQQVLQADTGSFVSQNTADKTSGWQLQQNQTINHCRRWAQSVDYHPTMTLQLPIEPSAIYLLTRSPDNMSVTELWQHQQL